MLPTEEFYIDSDGIKLHAKLSRPEGWERCPLAILLHGLTGHMEETHIVAIDKALVEAGIASLRVELYGHGKSEGEFRDHTLYKWINNVISVIHYAKSLDFASELYLLGHSQGGYTTVLVAGMFPDDLAAIVPLSPAIIIEDAARKGQLFDMSFDPEHVPEQINTPTHIFGGDYFRVAQTLHADEAIARYHGPVLLVHGTADAAVPVQYSIEAAKKYDHAQLQLIEGDDHCYNTKLNEVTHAVTSFLTWVVDGQN